MFAIEESRSPLVGTIQAWFGGAEGMLPVHRPFLPKKFACGPFNSIQCGNQEKMIHPTCWVSFWHSWHSYPQNHVIHRPSPPLFPFGARATSSLVAGCTRRTGLHSLLARGPSPRVSYSFPDVSSKPLHLQDDLTHPTRMFLGNFWTAGEGCASVNSINRKAKTMS